MAHVGGVWEVVVAEDAPEQAVHVGRFERGPAGGVEDDLLGIHGPQFGADRGDRLVPRDGDVLVAAGVVAHRAGQAPGLLQPVVRPGPELAHRVGGEEGLVDRPRGQLPGRRLGAVLAIFEGVRLVGLGPGAADAHEPLRLVLAHQQRAGGEEGAFAPEDLADGQQRTLPTGRAGVGGEVDGAVFLVGHRA